MPLRKEIVALPCCIQSVSLSSKSSLDYDLLPNLLTSVSAQLGSARRHDGIGWRDVCLLAAVSHPVSHSLPNSTNRGLNMKSTYFPSSSFDCNT
jgi:hypothetical protein